MEVGSWAHLLDSPCLEFGGRRVIDLKEIDARELRCKPPSQGIVAGTQYEDLGGTRGYAQSDLAFTERLSMSERSELTLAR